MLKLMPKAMLSMLRSSKRPAGRTWLEETVVRGLRKLIAEGQSSGIQSLRAQMEGLGVHHPALSGVELFEQQVSGVPCLMVRPKADVSESRVVVYIHGGGYITGSPSSYRALIADYALHAKCLVVAPDYRLAPEHAFPIPQDDCASVVAACLKTYAQRKVIVAGDSAGGALALAATASANIGIESDQQKTVEALTLLSPWVDPLASGGSIDGNVESDFLDTTFLSKSFEALMQGQNGHDERVNFSAGDLSHLPRTLVQYGTGELFYDQIHQFVTRAKSQGVEITAEAYQNQCHDFQMLSAFSKDAKLAMNRLGEFVCSV